MRARLWAALLTAAILWARTTNRAAELALLIAMVYLVVGMTLWFLLR